MNAALMDTAVDLGNDLWVQGSGRINVYNSILAKTLIVPGSLNFGCDNPFNPIWTTIDTIAIKNLSATSKTYNFALSTSMPGGFNFSFDPQDVSVNPGDTQQVIITVSIDNSIFPFQDSTMPFKGIILATADSVNIKIPFSLTNTQPVPLPPVLVQPLNNSSDISLTQTFSWNPALFATAYTWQISEDSTFTELLDVATGLTDPNYQPTGLAYSTSYYWRVRASNTIGTGQWSDIWQFTTTQKPKKITGNLYYGFNTLPLNNFTMTLKDSTGTVVSSTSTNDQGYFEFDNVLNGSYTIETTCNKAWGGANVIDVTLIRQYLAFMLEFSDLQKSASDVNMSGSTNVIDVNLMRQRLAWLDVPQWTIPNYVFEKPTVNVNGQDVSIIIRGLCAGDVNGSYIPPVGQ